MSRWLRVAKEDTFLLNEEIIKEVKHLAKIVDLDLYQFGTGGYTAARQIKKMMKQGIFWHVVYPLGQLKNIYEEGFITEKEYNDLYKLFTSSRLTKNGDLDKLIY